MSKKVIFCILLYIFISLGQAASLPSSAPVILPHKPINLTGSNGTVIPTELKSVESKTTNVIIPPNITQTTNSVNMTNLNNVDSNTDDLIQLKRKLEVEKAEAEIKKLHEGGSNTNKGNSSFLQDNAQTTVTGVAINQEGKKIAWLQFADGGSLTVNIGSQVGKYKVSDINMSGVKLTYGSGKNKTQNVFLKRAYYAPETSKSQANNGNKSFFSPSPIITSANTGNANEMVPPIVSIR